jgi:hypothetical protein
MKSFIGSLLVLGASMAQASNHVVVLGDGGALTFAPNQITAAVGDTVEFLFAAGVFTLSSPRLISRTTPSHNLLSQHLAYPSQTESGPALNSSRSPLLQVPLPGQPLQARLPPLMEEATRLSARLLPSPHSLSPSTIPAHCGSTAPRPSTVKPVWSWLSTSTPRYRFLQ